MKNENYLLLDSQFWVKPLLPKIGYKGLKSQNWVKGSINTKLGTGV